MRVPACQWVRVCANGRSAYNEYVHYRDETAPSCMRLLPYAEDKVPDAFGPEPRDAKRTVKGGDDSP